MSDCAAASKETSPPPACATLAPDGLVSHAHSKGGTTSTSPATRTPRTSGATGGIVERAPNYDAKVLV